MLSRHVPSLGTRLALASLPTMRQASTSTPTLPARSRSAKWLRRGGIVAGFGLTVYVVDKQFNASAVTRSLRTAYIGILCTIDYKLNFAPHKADKIEKLHERVASRLRWVIDTNQGLYLKLGQALGLQATLLPKPYREAFGHVFDRAPSVSYSEVVKVFQFDLGLSPTEVFAEFSEEPLASASIAQVHRARLKPGPGETEGRIVAVKVQKPAIKKQMELDLFSYRSLMWLAEKLFDMPMYFVANYVSEQMRLETSFKHEADNARKCAALLAQTPELRDDVYVPRVFGKAEGCAESDRIMVMEWVDGVRLNDKDKMAEMDIKPKDAMDLAISSISAMTFSWGFVHCDPHPGNLLVRKHPTKKGRPELVLIDHGLYINLTKSFREDYCTLWRSLFVLDIKTIETIAHRWGIAVDANMFASAILLRPFQVNKNKRAKAEEKPKTEYEQQVELKQRLKSMLENEQLIPRELIFLTRCQRMMQANNQTLGSPSARVNLTAKWAAIGYSRSITSPRTLREVGLKAYTRDKLNSVLFKITLGFVDLAFYWNQLISYFKPAQKGWEDRLQKQFEQMAKEEFGIEIDDTVFLG